MTIYRLEEITHDIYGTLYAKGLKVDWNFWDTKTSTTKYTHGVIYLLDDSFNRNESIELHLRKDTVKRSNHIYASTEAAFKKKVMKWAESKLTPATDAGKEKIK